MLYKILRTWECGEKSSQCYSELCVSVSGGGNFSEDASGAAHYGFKSSRVWDGHQRAQVGGIWSLSHWSKKDIIPADISVWTFYLSFSTKSSLVIDTLKDVDPSRKCFRLVGGVLVERTVKEVLPALESNKEQVTLRGQRFYLFIRHHATCAWSY